MLFLNLQKIHCSEIDIICIFSTAMILVQYVLLDTTERFNKMFHRI